jgi:hypothetical protein
MVYGDWNYLECYLTWIEIKEKSTFRFIEQIYKIRWCEDY